MITSYSIATKQNRTSTQQFIQECAPIFFTSNRMKRFSTVKNCLNMHMQVKKKLNLNPKLNRKINACNIEPSLHKEIIINIPFKAMNSCSYFLSFFTLILQAIFINCLAASSVLHFFGKVTRKYFNIPSKSSKSRSFLHSYIKRKQHKLIYKL